MRTLIVKLGATGDVVRTTPLLERLGGDVTWLTERKNAVLLEGVSERLRCVSWDERESVPDIEYDLIINLEDTLEIGAYLKGRKGKQWFGAYTDANDQLRYTDD